MLKFGIKILFSLIISSLFIGNSVQNLNAGFLDGDMGLNLYKDIEKGMTDFEDKQYKYEMKGQKDGEMSKNLNKILEKKQLGECLKEGLKDEDVDEIANGGIDTLKKKLKPECYDSEKKEYSQALLGGIISESSAIREHYKQKVDKKSTHIEEIARIGMYADGNKDNSPFDLIVDLREIDKIIFKTETNYDSDDGEDGENSEYEDLTNYLEDPDDPGSDYPFMDDLEDDGGSGSHNGNRIPGRRIPGGSGSDNGDDGDSNGGLPDSNNFLCINDINQSGLDDDSLAALLGTTLNNGTDYVFNYGSGGHIKLPDNNRIKFPHLSNPDFYDIINSLSGSTEEMEGFPYKEINDNKQWECNKFFCIIIEFVINNFSPLGYSDGGGTGVAGKSIENILETSAKHLKKAANSSLVQHKMTTNNFERSTRDLNLPDIFHMGIVISSHPSPILDLKKDKSEEEDNEENEEYVKNLLREKYSNLNLDFDKANDLNKFKKSEQELKSFTKSVGNSVTRPGKLINEYNSIRKVKDSVNDYSSSKLSKDINSKILSDFDKQFAELEQFTYQLLELVNGGQIIIKKMNKIPTYSG